MASRAKYEYGVISAGALSKSLIANLPRKTRQIGAIAGVSYRVASRMTNSLRAGYAARSVDELNLFPTILFHAPPRQTETIVKLLEAAKIGWREKALVFCDCDAPPEVADGFRKKGASIATARGFGIEGLLMVEGDAVALAQAHRLATQLKLKPIELTARTGRQFEAAITLATGALTPLIHRATTLLRKCGLRDADAVRIATTLCERTIQEYAHSGRQSWQWHVKEPETNRLESQLAALSEPIREFLRALLLAGFEDFEKHPAAAASLRASKTQPQSESSDSRGASAP